MIDAKNVHKQLNRPPTDKESDIQIINECIEQIAFADKLIINKLDLITNDELRDLETKLKV
jgi:G3E family GTPase